MTTTTYMKAPGGRGAGGTHPRGLISIFTGRRGPGGLRGEELQAQGDHLKVGDWYVAPDGGWCRVVRIIAAAPRGARCEITVVATAGLVCCECRRKEAI